jgi:hypothetical protein
MGLFLACAVPSVPCGPFLTSSFFALFGHSVCQENGMRKKAEAPCGSGSFPVRSNGLTAVLFDGFVKLGQEEEDEQ